MSVELIRPGVEPDIDAAREMRDYAWAQIDGYVRKYGFAPTSIAVVLMGDMNDADQPHSVGSWTPRNERVHRVSACATASAMLMKRALAD